MLPVVKILGFPIALYGFCILVGMAAGIILSIHIGKKRKTLSEDILFAFLYGCIGVAVGGKILYLFIEFPNLYHLFQTTENFNSIIPYLTGGFVFYGGILGGFVMIFIYCKKFNCSTSDIFAAILPAVPLVHAIGRIGCFCAGCCYGIPYDGFLSIVFSNAIAAPNHIHLFPIQLLEAVLNLLVCLELTIFSFRGMSTLKLFGVYLLEYSTIRFFLEFLRGDTVRGFYLNLSTSQWISLLLFVGGFVCIYKSSQNKNSTSPPTCKV